MVGLWAYLCYQNEEDEKQASVGAVDSKCSLEGDLIYRMPLVLPCCSEADMCQADGTPGEQGRETRESKKPIEDNRSACAQGDVTQGAEDQDGNG